MTVRNLQHLLMPRSVALVGASGREGSIGRIVAGNLIKCGFGGPLYLVNPKGGTIDGHVCFASIAAMPEAPDLAIIVTPAPTIPGLISELGSKGCRAAVVISAGVRGEIRQQMLDAAKPYLLRIQGPNCLGLMLPPIGLDASFSHIAPRPGSLAFISQSGALITGIVDWAESRGIGFSHVVSIGDMADVDFGDLLDYLSTDTASRAILLYMESLKSAPKFMSAARRAARTKPVVVIKAGRHASGAKAALSHTGALAGADAAFEAAFRRAGLVRVNELQDLFEAAEILSKVRPLEGDKLGIVTNGGGAGVLAADRLADLGLDLVPLAPATLARLDKTLPATWSRSNPVDIIGDAGAERYREAVEAVLDDPCLDALLVINCPTAVNPSVDAAKVVLEVISRHREQGRLGKPVISSWLGETAALESRHLFAEARVPSYATPAEAIDGFASLVRYRRAQTELMATPPSLPDGVFAASNVAGDVIRAVLATTGPRMLTEPEAKTVLAAYGIPVIETAVVATPAAAREAARTMIGPHQSLVLKILSKDITHKSDVGGVRLGLETADMVEVAASAMLQRAREAVPDAVIEGFTIQPMVVRPRSHELILGISEDPTFGPLLMFGAGGVAVEAVKDAAHALPPLDLNLARDLMRQTRVWRLLQGYRDRPPADLDAVALTLVRLGYLAARHPEIREIDINPLLADDKGVIALDARIRVEDQSRVPRVPMAIRPYPSEWEKRIVDGRGNGVRLRPIRPDDERLYSAFFSRVSPEDQRLRFFGPKAALSHAFLARLTQIDYAREMAFVALDEVTGDLLGVSRFMADPDFERGEYAVLVRSDLKGRGLGWALMSHLIDYATSAGLVAMFGHVLRENTTMVDMCRSLGFDIATDPEDTTQFVVNLELGRRAIA